MKQLFTIQDSLKNKISYYHAVAFVCLLPFDRFYTQLVLISFLLHSLFSAGKTNFKNVLRKEILVLSSVFILTVIGTAWTDHTAGAFGVWEKQLAILLFPLIIALNSEVLKYQQKILTLFALTCTAVIVYLYIDALRIISYYHLPLTRLFTAGFLNHNFSEPIHIHATYLAMYVALSAVFIVHQLFTKKTESRYRIIFLCCLVMLGAGLLQLASRSVLIATLLIMNFLMPFFLVKKQRSRYQIGSIIISFIAVFCIIKTDSLNLRLYQGLKEDLSRSDRKFSLADPRTKRWELGWQLFKASPVTGYGTAAEIPLLKEQYYRHKLYDSYLNDLNAHNQYLSFLIKGGIPALLVFLFTLAWGIRTAIRNRDIVFLAFLVILITVSVSENILDVNKGIFFYAFFFSIFLLKQKKTHSISVIHEAGGNPVSIRNVFTEKELSGV